MFRKQLAAAAVLAVGLEFVAGCHSCPGDRPLLSRLGLANRADRHAAEVCSQPCEGPVLEECGPPCAAPGNGGPVILTPQPGLPPLGPPPRLVPTPQPGDMPYAPPGSNGY